ncbi:hypothetical protein BKA04_000691 [Cryobacterium mesophilum]|uniref:DUF8094 domain-containing protein n=1 Tax=Terrimesophilobacter mesophilus TaxID=433647 RepID=A0A4R8VAC2_9MICO|nr:hypothetical protein [Terrimesophilobacter mesophilus]MBB5632468.1 hypothetical protein [Terrimesophilobacter mesophilus]TFB79296.1 hypothetical protein E3N84_04045 [Terrimesophilobacter mesophilus]
MRFIVAIVSFIVAFVMISYGIAQRTVLAEPDHVAASTALGTSAPVTVIDGKVLNSNPGRQKVLITGSGTVFAAYGKTTDVLAWIGDATYNEVRLNKKTSTLSNEVVQGTEATVPDPHDSDLWLDEFTRDNQLTFVVNIPQDVSVIILSDGTAPAPGQVSITWPVDNRTPWSGPLIVGGVLLLLAGLALYLWALSHLRKARGPRRRPPRMPKPPKRLKYKVPKQKSLQAPRGRRAAGRAGMVTGMVVAGALVLTGCTAESWPEFLGGEAASSPSPTPSVSAPPVSTDKPPVVSTPQLESIVSKIALVAQQADAERDSDLIAERFAGPALDLREANYAIRKADKNYKPLPAIPSSPVEVTLPQQNDKWPRTVFTVVHDPKDTEVAPTALMLVQQSPRENYKVVYAMQLESGPVLPELAAANVGTQRLQPDIKLFALQPDQLALAYGDVLLNGESSEYYKYFDLENDSLAQSIGFDAKQKRKSSIPRIAKMTFGNLAGDGEVIPMVTNDSGAIVATYLNETETVKPTEPGALINAEGAVKSLSRVSSTTKGTLATYGDQLLFYVPPASSGQKIVLIGWASALIAARELK